MRFFKVLLGRIPRYAWSAIQTVQSEKQTFTGPELFYGWKNKKLIR